MRALWIAAAITGFAGTALADDEAKPDNIAVSYSEDGRYFTEDDVPTYNINEEGAIDWPAYSGFRRYHSECHVCHGSSG